MDKEKNLRMEPSDKIKHTRKMAAVRTACSAVLAALILFAFLSCAFTANANDSIPCQDNTTFRESCARVSGKMAGSGRCYFFGNVSRATWSDGFSICAMMGGQFAQIHTTREFDLVQLLVNSKYDDEHWIAMRRSIYEHGRSCAITRNTTFWFDSDSDQPDANDTKVAAGNGPMFLRQANISTCDKQQTDNPGETCIYWDGTKWLDHNCQCNYHHVICQYTSRSQTYKRTSADKCIDEPPIEEFKANTPDECANRCSRSIWCRSFNFVEDLSSECNTSCELFSWSIEETCPNCPQTRPRHSNVTGTVCNHWNYVW